MFSSFPTTTIFIEPNPNKNTISMEVISHSSPTNLPNIARPRQISIPLNSGPVIGFCYQIEIFSYTYTATSCVQESLDHLRYFTGDLLLKTDSIESHPLIMSVCSDWWSLVPWHETVPHSLVLAHVAQQCLTTVLPEDY